MKKVYILLLLVLALPVQAQILNGGFEEWTDGNPTHWQTSNSPPTLENVKASPNGHSGAQCLNGYVATIFYVGFTPVLSSSTTSHRGFYMDKGYTSLKGWYKFTSAKGDQFQVSITASHGDTAVGSGTLLLGSATEWTEFNVPIYYPISSTPDSSIILVTIVGANNSSTVNAGSQFYLDDLSYGYLNETRSASTTEKLSVDILTNPCRESTPIRIQSSTQTSASIEVVDGNGKSQISSKQISLQAGSNLLSLETKELLSGVYYIRFSIGNLSETKKLIVLR